MFGLTNNHNFFYLYIHIFDTCFFSAGFFRKELFKVLFIYSYYVFLFRPIQFNYSSVTPVSEDFYIIDCLFFLQNLKIHSSKKKKSPVSTLDTLIWFYCFILEELTSLQDWVFLSRKKPYLSIKINVYVLQQSFTVFTLYKPYTLNL